MAPKKIMDLGFIQDATLQKFANSIVKSELSPFDPETFVDPVNGKGPPTKVKGKAKAKDAMEPADTFGWDTSFSCKYPDVNDAIANKGSSPKGFEQEHDEDGIEIAGGASFGDWELAQGGNGRLIHMLIPFSNAHVGVVGGNAVQIGGGRLYIEVQLDMLPHEKQSARAMANEEIETVELTTKTKDSDGNNLPVGVVQCIYDDEPSINVDVFFRSVFSAWINENLDQFHHIFAVIDINHGLVPHDQWAFVEPSYTSYACLTRDTVEECVFSVLNMTGGRTGENNNQQTSPFAITEGHRAAYLVSQERFLVDLVKPLVTDNYPGMAPDDLVLNENRRRLDLKQPVNFEDVEVEGEFYTPVCNFMEIRAEPTELIVDARAITDMRNGYSALTSTKSFYKVVLTNQSDGKQTLTFEETKEAEEDSQVIDSEKRAISTGALSVEARGIFAALAKKLLKLLIAAAVKVIATMIMSLLLGKPESDADDIGGDKAPPVDLLVLNSVEPIEWPDSSGMTLEDAGLNLSLHLRGFLTPDK